MSLLNANQRAVIHADTGVHPILIDRATDAFDALIRRGDVEAYVQYMAHAWAQMGFDESHPIREEDRPTALDKIKTILIHAYADQEHISYTKAHERLTKMLKG